MLVLVGRSGCFDGYAVVLTVTFIGRLRQAVSLEHFQWLIWWMRYVEKGLIS